MDELAVLLEVEIDRALCGQLCHGHTRGCPDQPILQGPAHAQSDEDLQ